MKTFRLLKKKMKTFLLFMDDNVMFQSLKHIALSYILLMKRDKRIYAFVCLTLQI